MQRTTYVHVHVHVHVHVPQVMGPAAAPAGPGHHRVPYGAVARLGDQLEAQDPHGNWLGASVVDERGHGDERELLVHYHRGRHYSGRIVDIDRAHDSFTVSYDDGDTEQDVQRASLRFLE